MSKPKFSRKGRKLIKMYEKMARDGYDRSDNRRVENAFSDFELRFYRHEIREKFREYSIATVLDYGCGGSDWQLAGFDDSGQSATEYFGLSNVFRYEPARGLDERRLVDCVISFDVLEHIFISDVTNVLRDIFSCASKLAVLNVACYPAAAKLPNGENAHITVRHPLWWKGVVDCVSTEYPDVMVWLICSTGWRKSSSFQIWSDSLRQRCNTFVVNF